MGANTEDPNFGATLTNRVYVSPPQNRGNRNQFAMAINRRVLEPEHSIVSNFFSNASHIRRNGLGSRWALVIMKAMRLRRITATFH